MRRRGGFSLLEVLVVTGIILILASLLAPVLAQAKSGAKQTGSKNNLRQIYAGLMMYREDYDPKVEFGMASEMGLPETLMASKVYLDVVPDKGVWRSPCCCHKDASSGSPDYSSYLTDYSEKFHAEEIWTDYVRKWEGSSILIEDFHCNDASLDLYRPRRGPVRGLGIRLNGKAETRIRRVGISAFSAFWNW